MLAHLHRSRGNSGNSDAVFIDELCDVTDGKGFRVARQAAIRLDFQASGSVLGNIEVAGNGVGHHPGGPDNRSRFNGTLVRDNAMLLDVFDHRVQSDIDIHFLQCA